MTAGLLIGSATRPGQSVRRNVYFRDPKILLAFAMWLAYVAMIYIRRSGGPSRTPRRLSLQLRLPGQSSPSGPPTSSPPSTGSPPHEQTHRHPRDEAARTTGPASVRSAARIQHNRPPRPPRHQPQHRAPLRYASASPSPPPVSPTPRAPSSTSPGVREALILSTCNRVELLTLQDTTPEAPDEALDRAPATDLLRFLHEYFSVPAQRNPTPTSTSSASAKPSATSFASPAPSTAWSSANPRSSAR